MADHPDPISETPATLPSPASFARIPDHVLSRLIGKGSYGEVWLGKNTLGAFRAVKIVYEQTFRHRRPFDREFNGVQKFEPISRLHDGLMDVLQVGRNDEAGYFYCVMELADDVTSGQAIDPATYSPRTLAHDLARLKRLPVAECRRVVVAIASALDFLHGHGLIHRDIKPSNIVFVNGVPKLADIGLVAEMSEAKSYVGTEGFIPPEGPGTVRADIYSLGKVLYEISTGKDRHDYPDLPTRLGDPAEEQQSLELNNIVLKACRADPAQRFKSAGGMRDALLALSGDDGQPLQNTRRYLRRRTAAFAGLALFICLIVASPLLAHRHAAAPASRVPAAAKTPVAVPAPDGLVAWWKGEGDQNDSAHDFRIADLDGVGFGVGKVGQGFSFDGAPHHMIVSNAPALNFGSNQDFSIEAWIQPLRAETELGLMTIVDKASLPGEGQLLGYGLELFDGRLRFGMSDDFTPWAFSSFGDTGPDLRDGRFHHVAVTVRRNSRTGGALFVDGKVLLMFDPTSHPGDLSNTEELRIGNGPLHASHFKGVIDEVAIYNRALSVAEIQSIFEAGSAGKSSRNLSSASFGTRLDLAVPSGPKRIVTADFDGDGRPDLAVAAGFANKISIFRNTGTNGSLDSGSFDLPLNLSIGTGAHNPIGVAAADVDGDGKIDLIVPDRTANRVAVFKNISTSGVLAFAAPVFFDTGKNPVRVAVGDLDGDGRPDIVVVNNDDNSISILRNTGAPGSITAGSFALRVNIATGNYPTALAIGDLDGDGKPDLAVANAVGSSVSIFHNLSVSGVIDVASFAPGFDLVTPSNCMSVVIGDVDGDGKADLLAGSWRVGRMLSIYRNISRPGVLSPDSFAARVDFPADGCVNDMALGDLNGDGRPDIALATEMPNHISVFQNLSTPGVITTNSLGRRLDFISGFDPAGIVIIDLDGDQRPDLAFGNYYSGTITIYRNVGSMGMVDAHVR